jgi:hypothetical protein
LSLSRASQCGRAIIDIELELSWPKTIIVLYDEVEKTKYLVHIPTMRLNLAKFLLLVMTITGIIMPIYAYAHEMTETQNSQTIETDSSHDTDGVSKSCDHCCHFSSHSLGLMRVSSKIVELSNTYIPTVLKQNYASYKQPPPYQPPIIS